MVTDNDKYPNSPIVLMVLFVLPSPISHLPKKQENATPKSRIFLYSPLRSCITRANFRLVQSRKPQFTEV